MWDPYTQKNIPIQSSPRFINPCFITPRRINPCFINPVHVLPIQSSPCFITCHLMTLDCPRVAKEIVVVSGFLLGCPFQGCPVINSVFGRLCRKTVPGGRKTRESGTKKRCSHKWFHMIFPCTDPCMNTFCTSSPPPPPPSPPQKPRRRCEPAEGYLRCSKRFHHRSHSFSFVIVRVEVS